VQRDEVRRKDDLETSDVRYPLNGEVALITIDRADARNALDRGARSGLRAAFERFEAGADARVAILTGAGDRSFWAGMNLKQAAQAGLGVSAHTAAAIPTIRPAWRSIVTPRPTAQTRQTPATTSGP
jgi:enoyl-CoA hydratase/carnithine racemase